MEFFESVTKKKLLGSFLNAIKSQMSETDINNEVTVMASSAVVSPETNELEDTYRRDDSEESRKEMQTRMNAESMAGPHLSKTST